MIRLLFYVFKIFFKIQINTYMESIAFKNKKKSVQKVNSELTAVRKSTLTQNDKMPYLIKIKTMDIDILEIKNTEDQREFYAARAMQ